MTLISKLTTITAYVLLLDQSVAHDVLGQQDRNQADPYVFDCNVQSVHDWFPVFGVRFAVPIEFKIHQEDTNYFEFVIDKGSLFDVPMTYTIRAIRYGNIEDDNFSEWKMIELHVENYQSINVRERTSAMPDGTQLYEAVFMSGGEFVQISSVNRVEWRSFFDCLF